jgi:acyl-CoA oxidase
MHRLAVLHGQLNAAGKLPNPLDLERERASFPVGELTNAIYGGKRLAELRRRIQVQVVRDSILSVAARRADMSREEERYASATAAARMIELLRTADVESRSALDWMFAASFPSAHGRLSNHMGLFEPAFRLLGSDDQVAAWDAAMRGFSVLGCFGLSEVAHASNAAGIETLAEYDVSRQEFVITSPRAESGKFWIGSAGGSATHALIYARLIVRSVDYGVNVFVVQLRRLMDGSFMPGVSCKDTGPKMGRNGLDNGYILLSGVRIPRSAMLARYTQIDADGAVTRSPLQQLAYGALVLGRVVMIGASSAIQAMALTITSRYLLVRRQFAPPVDSTSHPIALMAQDLLSDPVECFKFVDVFPQALPSMPVQFERAILDYPLQQRRLVPLIAGAFAIHATGRVLQRLYDNTQKTVGNVLTSGDLSALARATSELKRLHAWSAGMFVILCEIARVPSKGDSPTTHTATTSPLQASKLGAHGTHTLPSTNADKPVAAMVMPATLACLAFLLIMRYL